MGDKEDELGLGLSLSLSLGYGANANNAPLKVTHMHKPPQSVPNQRVSFNNFFHFHGV